MGQLVVSSLAIPTRGSSCIDVCRPATGLDCVAGSMPRSRGSRSAARSGLERLPWRGVESETGYPARRSARHQSPARYREPDVPPSDAQPARRDAAQAQRTARSGATRWDALVQGVFASQRVAYCGVRTRLGLGLPSGGRHPWTQYGLRLGRLPVGRVVQVRRTNRSVVPAGSF